MTEVIPLRSIVSTLKIVYDTLEANEEKGLDAGQTAVLLDQIAMLYDYPVIVEIWEEFNTVKETKDGTL